MTGRTVDDEVARRDRRGRRAQRPRRGDRARARRALGPRLRGGRHRRRRDAVGRAHAARVRPRRLLGRPPAGDRVAVLPVLDLARHGVEWVHPDVPVAHALDAGTERGAGARSLGPGRGLRRSGPTPPPGPGCSGRWRASGSGWSAELLRPVVRAAAPPDPDGPLRPAGAAPARRPRAARASAGPRRGRCSRASRRTRCCGSDARLGVVRARARAARARRRLAAGARRQRAHRRGARGGGPVAGRRDRDGPADRLAGRAARGPGGAARPHAAAGARGRGRPPAAGYRRRLEGYRYGPGVYKVDWALDGPIPWRDPQTARAGTVHLGGTMREVAAAEDAVAPRPASPSARSCCSSSRPSPTRRARRRASTSPGPTATSPTAGPVT